MVVSPTFWGILTSISSMGMPQGRPNIVAANLGASQQKVTRQKLSLTDRRQIKPRTRACVLLLRSLTNLARRVLDAGGGVEHTSNQPQGSQMRDLVGHDIHTTSQGDSTLARPQVLLHRTESACSL